MKNLITTIGSIIIILAMVMQVTANQKTYTKLICIDQLVNNFKEVAKEEGFVSEENKAGLVNQISQSTGISKGNISVRGTSVKKKRGDLIDYTVNVKLNNIMAAPRFWGVSREDNSGNYIIKQSTTSEYLVGA